MSKVFDAYRKKAGSDASFSRAVRQVGSAALFPVPTEQQADDFNVLATNLLNLRVGTRGTVFSFASSESGEGGSFVSFHVATVLAQCFDQKVIWIDANFLSPQKALSRSETLTFADLLDGSAQPEDLPTATTLQVLPGGNKLTTMRGYLAGEEYGNVLAKLAETFGIVIVDLPPVLKCSETALMSAASDGLVLVVEQKFLKWEVVGHGVETLQEKNVRMLGSVINRRDFVLPKFIYDRL